MKPFIHIIGITLVLLLTVPNTTGFAQTTNNKKKVAVVLSGGGAKGVAHIGALQVIEDAGIQVDYVVGTSMGAIIGGLYSIGFTPTQLDSLVRSQDWNWLLSDKPKRSNFTLIELENDTRYAISIPLKRDTSNVAIDGIIKGDNLNSTFSSLTVGYHDSIDFLNLPKPFTCIATDLVTGDEIVINKGVLAEAMRASMAIPFVFSPVRQHNKILSDGGMVNNFPVDIARNMGADIIIGVDVQSELSNDSLTSVIDILGRIIDLTCLNKFEENRNQTDVYINVDVKGYSAASFNAKAIDSLIERGQIAALSCSQKLDSLAKLIGSKPHTTENKRDINPKIPISTIQFKGNKKHDDDKLIKRCLLKNYSTISIADIEYAQHVLRNQMDYTRTNYRLYPQSDSTNKLVFMVERDKKTKLNLGVRFDTDESVALLINARTNLFSGIPELSITGRLGKQYMGEIKYSLNSSSIHDIEIFYTYWYHTIDIYEKGKRICNLFYNQHNTQIDYVNLHTNNLRFKAGLGFEFYYNLDLLDRRITIPTTNDTEHLFIKYNVQSEFNNQNRNYFPTQGFKAKFKGTLYTDNFIQYKKHSPFIIISASASGAFPIAKHLTFLPAIYGRVIDGYDIPYFYNNSIGGEFPAKYFPHQLPFSGIGKAEMTENALVTASTKLRYNINDNHYVSIIANVAFSNNSIYHVFVHEFFYGIGICYSYDSKLGPLELSFSYSDRTDYMTGFMNLGVYF